MKYRVNEIFESIQGEGSYSGTLVKFVRFAGCNMKCDFCDTDFKDFKELTSIDIGRQLESCGKSQIVVFTGGEPMLQLDQDLINYVKKLYYDVHIETNGSIDILLDRIDHLVVSPKDPFKWLQKDGDDLKLLVGPNDDNLPLDYILNDTSFKNYFLQPIDGPRKEEAIKNCINLIKQNPDWRLSLQIHKIINVR